MHPKEIVEAILGLSAGLVGCWAAVVLIRGLAKRLGGSTPAAPSVANQQLPRDFAARWERMEQSVEALAIEVERISEAQRFTTKLLSERAPARLPSPEPHPRRHPSPSGGVPTA